MTHTEIFNKYKDILKENGFDVSNDYKDSNANFFRWSSSDSMKSFTINYVDNIPKVYLTNLECNISQQSLIFDSNNLSTDFVYFYYRQKR